MKIVIDGNEINLKEVIKTKKEKPAEIICKVDGELIEFKNENALKAFMWKERPETVIRYNIAGVVSVPFELVTK